MLIELRALVSYQDYHVLCSSSGRQALIFRTKITTCCRSLTQAIVLQNLSGAGNMSAEKLQRLQDKVEQLRSRHPSRSPASAATMPRVVVRPAARAGADGRGGEAAAALEAASSKLSHGKKARLRRKMEELRTQSQAQGAPRLGF